MAGTGRKNADAALLAALTAGKATEDAAAAVGVSPRTAYRRLADPAFRQRLAEAQAQLVAQALGKVTASATAAATLEQLLTAESETVRLGAARTILELGTKVRENSDLAARMQALERLLAGHNGGGLPAMTGAQLRQRLARAEKAAAVLCLPTLPPLTAPADAGEVAAELARSFRDLVESYREYYKLSRPEAVARASEHDPSQLDRIVNGPPDEVSWFDLEAVAQKDPEEAQRAWERIKQAARSELRSGHRAARMLEAGVGTCWERARYLALRTELAVAWQPRNALEQQFLDQAAQFQTLLEHWLEVLVAHTTLAALGQKRALEGRERYEPPRLSDAAAQDRAAGLVERLHRLYLRTLRALQDQRRLQPPVIVRRAGQVNVAQQQINVAAAAGPE
jgi:hypothetical protein